MMRSKTPKPSPDELKRRKADNKAAAAAALAANALAKLPEEKERRDVLFLEVEALQEKAKEASALANERKKEIRDIYGITAQAEQVRKILLKCPDGIYEATLEQVALFLKDANRPYQLPMDLQPGKGVDPAGDEPAFDVTPAGERHVAERKDDPARARPPARSKPVAPKETGRMSLEEAEAAFKKTSGLAPSVDVDLVRVGLGPDAFH